MFNPCIIIPVFNHELAIAETVLSIKPSETPIILVNDGSNSTCTAVLRDIAHHNKHIHLVEHEINLGKGGAFKTGIREASKHGYTHALQVDADGQHDTQDVPRFFQAAQQHPDAIINGTPIYDESIPKHRYYGRYVTHVWVWINTLSFDIADSMCGFRLYPVEATKSVINSSFIGNRMDFDTEILVRCYWKGMQVIPLPTQVIYPENGISHFRAFKDNVRITLMHTRLFFGMLPRIPLLLIRKLRKVL
jgi:glycosyltransferase involved in cell wall biosynthesis